MVRRCYILLSIAIVYGISLVASVDKPAEYKCFQKRIQMVNQVEMWIANWGEFGQNPARTAGTFWPRGSGEAYIFGAGLWIGAFVEKEYEDSLERLVHTFLFPGGNLPDTLIGDVLVSSGYNTVGRGFDFIPGPPDSVHIWDHWYDPESHPEDRLYFSTDSLDFLEWPLRNEYGKPISAVFRTPDRWADEEVWCEYNDLCDSIHHELNPFPTYPLGLGVRQISFGWNTPDFKDMLFIIYEFENVSDDTIRHMFVGHASDPDVGDADNDIVGLDILRQLAWTTNLQSDIWWYERNYVGICVLQGPKADYEVVVRGYDNEGALLIDTLINEGERLSLTSLQICNRQYEPDEEFKRYIMLAGYKGTQYHPFGELPDELPGDKRMIMGCGPFEMVPGEVDTFAIAIMFSNASTGVLYYLKSEAELACLLYNYDWAYPSPPPSPRVTLTPSDERVTIVWNNVSLTTSDPFYPIMIDPGVGEPVIDTLYREYDFEGFRLWKSKTGMYDDWDLIYQWDVKNDITLLPGDVYVPELGNMSGQESNNTGITFSYVDEDVINGVRYYYAVTTYDFNTPGDYKNKNQDVWVARESGIEPYSVIPRAEPCDMHEMETGISRTKGLTNVVTFGEVMVEAPMVVTGDSYKLIWGETFDEDEQPVYTYRIYNQTRQEWVSSTPYPVEVPTELRYYTNIDGSMAEEWFGTFTTPVFDGLAVSGEIKIDLTVKYDTFGNNISAVRLPDSIIVLVGDYPDSALEIDGFYEIWGLCMERISKKWAYKGGIDIEMRWIKAEDTLTCEVWDVTNDAQIPPNTVTDDGWCFSGRTPIKPTKTWLTEDDRSIWFYICGVRYLFNGWGSMTPDQFNQITDGDVWRIYSSCNAIMPGRGNEFTIKADAIQFGRKGQLDRVKVVPNPYVAHAEWDRGWEDHWVHFTRLTSECTIRIYSLSGDLIRIIDHSATSEGDILDEIGGMEPWNLKDYENESIASGIYLYHISTPLGEEKIGKFAIVR